MKKKDIYITKKRDVVLTLIEEVNGKVSNIAEFFPEPEFHLDGSYSEVLIKFIDGKMNADLLNSHSVKSCKNFLKTFNKFKIHLNKRFKKKLLEDWIKIKHDRVLSSDFIAILEVKSLLKLKK